MTVTISFQDPDRLNNNGDNPSVRRVDLITGSISKSATDPADDTNTSTRVIARFGQSEWSDLGNFRSVSYTLSDIRTNTYLRVRGTNGNELEPEPDPRGGRSLDRFVVLLKSHQDPNRQISLDQIWTTAVQPTATNDNKWQ